MSESSSTASATSAASAEEVLMQAVSSELILPSQTVEETSDATTTTTTMTTSISATTSADTDEQDWEQSLSITDSTFRWYNFVQVERFLQKHGITTWEKVFKSKQSNEAVVVFRDAEQKRSVQAQIDELNKAQGKTVIRAREVRERRRKRVASLAATLALPPFSSSSPSSSSSSSGPSAKRHKPNHPTQSTASSNADDDNDDADRDADAADTNAANENADDDDAADDDDDNNKTLADSTSAARTVVETATPYGNLPYDVQLKRKFRHAAHVLKQCLKTIRHEHPAAVSTLAYDTEHQSLCRFEGIAEAPVVDGYRNKCDFSFGLNPQGEKTIGFLLGRFVDGVVTVDSPEPCLNVSRAAKSIVAHMTAFLRHSDLPVWDKIAQVGVWRILSVRNTTLGEVMVTIQINPEPFKTMPSVESEGSSLSALDVFKAQARDHLLGLMTPEWSAEHDQCVLKCLQLQYYSGQSNAAPDSAPLELLYGDSQYIHEKLFDLRFRISHYSFFQVNTRGAEKLYSLAAEWAQCAPTTTLFDVCCGTGTIGLVMASKVGKVVGLEIVPAAIEDAKANAQLNGITNAVYVCGKAEETIDAALREHALTDDVVAIVDPPRAGLHLSVVRGLRSCERMKRIVYVSCNPKTLSENLIRFVQPVSKRWRGTPFTAVKAIAVDMFPHTNHCEMIVLLERK